MTAILELEGVTKSYGGDPALGPIDLTLPEGAVGLLGPNGAGKTTLLRIMLGLLEPTSGTVRVLGDEPGPAMHHRIGYVPEGDTVFPNLTGVEGVTYAGELVGMHRGDALKRAHEVLDYVRLGEERYRLAQTYSTGMKQRLKLAQALVHDPELLVLDEPTEGVDPEARFALLDLIRSLRDEHGMKILISTHIMSDVERLATHALVLSEGKVAAYGTLDELRRASTQAHYVRVAGPSGRLESHLTEKGVRWEAHDPNLRVELADPREVLRYAREAGVSVRHLAPATLTLEEAFEQAVSTKEVASSG